MILSGKGAPPIYGDSLTYCILSAPVLAIPVEGIVFLGEPRDLERGVLHLIAPDQKVVRYPYIPVQAIPQGMAEPDLIVEVSDGNQILTTLHYGTIWRGMQRDRHPQSRRYT